MKKKLNILGRKVPILAVMMALLVIGTASAALILNYATLSGTFNVDETLTVNGGVSETITFNEIGVGTFTIENEGDGTDVYLKTRLYLDPDGDGDGSLPSALVTDTEGITITYTSSDIIDPAAPGDVLGVYEDVTATVTGGTPGASVTTAVTVTLVATPGVETGVYTLEVDVDPTPTTS